MTRKELMALKDGTIVYNGKTEGIIKTECGEKVIAILISISGMRECASSYEERPSAWEVIDE